ncbi:MAG: hypothetical protein J7L55_01385 [Desulfurococcales archaeon]|nr:hypothetical protein [Desulfurococcales archaeon]
MKRPPCEVIVKELMPLLRACLARILINDYGYSIYQASKLLGVTPAAISNYLTAKRADERLVKAVLEDEKFSKLMRSYAESLVNREMEAGDVLCILCRKITSDKKYELGFKTLHERLKNNGIKEAT